MAWHYRDADPHFGAWQAKDMQIHMEDVMSNLPLEILQGNRLVEVRHIGVNKSLVLEEVLRQGPSGADPAAPPPPATSSPATGSRGAFGSAREFGDPPSTPAAAAPEADSSPSTQAEPARGEEFDFVLCVGDDRSDEDMYTPATERKSFRTIRVEAPVSTDYQRRSRGVAATLVSSRTIHARLSTDYPRRSRGVAATLVSSRTIRARLSTDHPRRGRGVVATRLSTYYPRPSLHGLSTS